MNKLNELRVTARSVWDENPALHPQYNHNFESYLAYHVMAFEAREEWAGNPNLQAEFLGNFQAFVAYKQAKAEGMATIITGRTVKG